MNAFDEATLYYNHWNFYVYFKSYYQCLLSDYGKTDHEYYAAVRNENNNCINKERGGSAYVIPSRVMTLLMEEDLVKNYEINYRKHCENLKKLLNARISKWIIDMREKLYKPSAEEVKFLEYGNREPWSNEELLLVVKGFHDGLDCHQIRLKGRSPFAILRTHQRLLKRFNSDVLGKVAKGEITLMTNLKKDSFFIKEMNIRYNKNYIESKFY